MDTQEKSQRESKSVKAAILKHVQMKKYLRCKGDFLRGTNYQVLKIYFLI